MVKWSFTPYTKCSWSEHASLVGLPGYMRVKNYMKRVEDLDRRLMYMSREEREAVDVDREMDIQAIEEYKGVERVVGHRTAEADEADEDEDMGEAPPPMTEYLVKWRSLPYAECTWESELDLAPLEGGAEEIELYRAREARIAEPSVSGPAARDRCKFRAYAAQPPFLAFGQLRNYQLEGLNFMMYSWSEDRNVILADEMGLGKTVQTSSFLGCLAEDHRVRGPFLVMVPLSTVPNWIKEFRRWLPQMSAVVYIGDAASREVSARGAMFIITCPVLLG